MLSAILLYNHLHHSCHINIVTILMLQTDTDEFPLLDTILKIQGILHLFNQRYTQESIFLYCFFYHLLFAFHNIV